MYVHKMTTPLNQQHQQWINDVVCEKCDDIGELLHLSVRTGLQGNNDFEGHLNLIELENARYFGFKDGWTWKVGQSTIPHI